MQTEEIERIKKSIEAIAKVVEGTHAPSSAYLSEKIHNILYHP